MALSAVKLSNKALIKLGAETIISLTQDTKSAVLCNQVYESVRDEVLAEYPWNRAVFRKSLARLSDTPVSGYSYQYALPTNPYCLRALKATGDYRIEGRTLLTNETSVVLKYIGRITDETQLDPLLADAISAKIAYEISYALTQSRDTQQMMLSDYMLALSRAKNASMTESPPTDSGEDPWIDEGR